MVECKCEVCESLFEIHASEKRRGGGRFCSRECTNVGNRGKLSKRWKDRKIIKCYTCGKEILVTENILKNGKRYCSNKCRFEGNKRKVERICKTCGKIFMAFPSEIKKGGSKYCSRFCSNIAQSKRYSEKRVERVCKWCGKNFQVNPSKAGIETTINGRKTIHGQYCSKKCRWADVGRKLSGSNCHLWNGGSSFEPYCPMFNNEFRNRVLAFWGNKCLLCGKTMEENGKNMDVHHVNYDKMVCCDGVQPIMATLCRSCHSKTNHDRERWESFLEDKIIKDFKGKSFYTIEEYREFK
jgi:hypothetical protein